MEQRFNQSVEVTKSRPRRGLFAMLAGVLLAGTFVVAPVAVPSASAAGTITLLQKNVSPPTTAVAPALPGTVLNYTISYDCSGINAGDNCAGAVISDMLPTFTDIYGNLAQLDLVSATALDPSEWTFQGPSGSVPNVSVSWLATANLEAGETGAVILQLRVPNGTVPATPVAQQVDNSAQVSLAGQPDGTVGPATSYINALAPQAGLSKSGPASALLNAAGTDSITHTIGICPVAGHALFQNYVVTDTLPPGVTVDDLILPYGGVFTPGTPSTSIPPVLPATEPTIVPGTGGTIVWNLNPALHPPIDLNGCMAIAIHVSYKNAAAGGDLTNEIGATKTNSVSAIGSNPTGPPQIIGPATTTLTLNGPVTRFSASKNTGGNYYVQNGDTVTYHLGASNSSDAEALPFSTATLADGAFPAAFTLTEIRTGNWTGSAGAVTASIETSPDGSSWTQISTTPSVIITSPALSSARYVRWVFTSSGAPAIGPGWSATGQQLIGTVAGSPPALVTNCASLTGVQSGILQTRPGACATVALETPQPHADVAKSSPSVLEPGHTITYTLSLANDIDATGPLVDPQLTDCVPDSAHLVVGNVLVGGGWSIELGPTPSACTPTAPSTPNSGTLIQFQYTGSLAPGSAAPDVTYDVTADSFHFPLLTDTPVLPGTYDNTVLLRDSAGTPYNHCVQANCSATNSVVVPVTANLRSEKLVKGVLDNDFNKAGTTTPGGQVTWKIEVQNVGNVSVDQVQYVDVFGYVGDTGVRRTDQLRGSEFAPFLTSPITVPAFWTVEYSLSNNPCRPEVLGPTTGCDVPNWTSTPSLPDLPNYRSIRFTFAGRIDVGNTLSVQWNMATPVFDPSYDTPNDTTGPYDQLDDCTIPASSPPFPGGDPGNTTLVGSRTEAAAWIDANADGIQQSIEGGPTCPRTSNSFAYGVHVPADQLNGLGDPGRLGAEPPKVDLHVAAPPPPNSLGNRVWNDVNNDGIQGPVVDEPGIPFVRVDLYTAGHVFVQTTFTDLNGNYTFELLPDGDYIVRFFMPDDRGYISPQDASGGSIDVGTLNTDDDSDIPELPTGNLAGENYYETAVVSLGDVVSQSEADPTWDAGIWIPNPSISLKKYVFGGNSAALPGDDAQSAPGPNIPRGNAVTWTYDITNTGNTYLKNVTLVDDVITGGGADPVPLCVWGSSSDSNTGIGVLSPGETVSCTASGTAVRGQYHNDATVTGTPTLDDGVTAITGKVDANGTALPTTVTDTDPAHYFGVEYDLALAKVADVTSVAQGGTIVWTIRVANQGNVISGPYTVTDVLPAGLTFVTSSVPPTTTVGRTLTWNRASMNAGATRDITITTTVNDINMRPYRNWAEVSADSAATLYSTSDWDSTPNSNVGDDSGAGSGTGPDDLVVDNTNILVAIPDTVPNDEDDNDPATVTGDMRYDLALVKTVSPTPLVGANGLATWTITVKNQGNLASGAYTVTDHLPSGLDFLTSVPAASSNVGRTYTWTMPNLAVGATTTITVNTRINDQSQKPFVNWAEISSDSASDYTTVVSTVTDVDSTPDAFIGDDPGAGSGTGPTNSVAAPEQNIDRTANGDVNTDAPGDEDDSDQAVLNSDILYDLALVKTVDASTVQLNDTITWTIKVKNQGNVASHGYTVVDTLPAGLMVSSAVPAAASTVGQTMTWNMPDLVPGVTATIVVTTTISDVNKRSFRNWAEISNDSSADYATTDEDSTPDSNAGTDNVAGTGTGPNDVVVDQTVLPVAQHNDPLVDEDDNDFADVAVNVVYDLALVKTVLPTPLVGADGLATWTITVKNQGNVPSGAYTVTDRLPVGLTFLTSDQPYSSGLGRIYTWTMPNLAPGQTATINVDTIVNDQSQKPFVNWAEISSDSAGSYSTALTTVTDVDSTPDAFLGDDAGPGSGTGPTNSVSTPELNIDRTANGDVNSDIANDEDDSDQAVLNSDILYDLALVKTVDASPVQPDSTITWTIKVKNQGNVNSNGYTVMDTMADGLTVTNAVPAATTSAGQDLTWDMPNLAPGATATIVITTTIDDVNKRAYRNWAEITDDSAADYATVDDDSTPDTDIGNDAAAGIGTGPAADPNDVFVDQTVLPVAQHNDPLVDEDDNDYADVILNVAYDLAVAKVADVTSIDNENDVINYTVTVANQGTLPSGQFTVVDTLPSGLTAPTAITGGGVWNLAARTTTWTIPNLAVGATLTFTYTTTVGPMALPNNVWRNLVEITSDSSAFYGVTDGDSTPGNGDVDNGADNTGPTAITQAGIGGDTGYDDEDIAVVTSGAVYDLALAKTNVVTGSGEDTSIDYEIVVANQGTLDSRSFTVLDIVPPGLVVDEGSISDGGTYDALAGTITWALTGLLPGSPPRTLEWSATVGDFALRPYRNYAEISQDGAASYGLADVDSSPDADNTNDTELLTYDDAGVDNLLISEAGNGFDPEDDADIADADVSLEYDLALAKVPSATFIDPSGSVVFTITIENQGDVNSGDFTVTDALPAGTVGTAASDSGTINASSVVWHLTNLAPGATRTVTVTVAISDPAQRPFKNIAEISADGADDYDAVVPFTGSDVEDVDSIPDATTTNDNGLIPTDGYGTYEAPLNDLDSIADVNSIANGEDDADVAFFDVPVLYDLALVKTGPAQIDGAGTATFTIQIKNQGNVGSGNFTVLDTIPTGLTAVAASNSGVISGQSVTWNLSGLAAGATTSVTVTVRVVAFASGPWVNIAEISADGADSFDSDGYQNAADGDVEDDDSIPDSNPTNDTLVDQTVLPTTQHNDPTVDSDDHDVAPIEVAVVYDLALVKILPANQSFKKDSNITFVVQVKNQGNVDSGPVTVVDLIPAGLSFVSATNNPLVAGQAVSWDLPSIAPDGVLSITIVVKITDITQPSYVNRAEIVTDGADLYDMPGKDIEDEDSTPDSNVFNDPLIDTDDVNIDVIPGDEDDHDRAMLDTSKVASDNPAITGLLPTTGSDLQPLLFTAAGLLGAGVLGLLAIRRRRRPVAN